MEKIFLYNSLTRRKEEFVPTQVGSVGLYTCGPTVYDFAHIGNLRTYIFDDILVRVLQYNGYKVKRVMNITDVGHLTGDRDMGEDKMEKGAQREGKSAWEVAEFYTTAFKADMERLNLLPPDIWSRATDTIEDQINLVKILEKKEYTYKISDGIYFDTAKFPDYTKLSHQNLEALKEGARVEKNDEKKNPTDFALWKFTPAGVKRQMEWSSPWGTGFPGWHLECSAMSMKFLDQQMDIHTGGEDHVNVHHTNEIAQSEAATGQPFFNIWMHGAFLNIQGGKKMAKSEENFLTLKNAFINKGIDPLVYRYAALQTYYKKIMEYSEDGLENAAKGYEHLQNQVREIGDRKSGIGDRKSGSGDRRSEIGDRESEIVNRDFKDKFLEAINDDLNMPQAMAVVQELLKSDLPEEEKLVTILDFDKVLGLDLGKVGKAEDLPDEIKRLVAERDIARVNKNFLESDNLRDALERKGYTVEDAPDGTRVYKK